MSTSAALLSAKPNMGLWDQRSVDSVEPSRTVEGLPAQNKLQAVRSHRRVQTAKRPPREKATDEDSRKIRIALRTRASKSMGHGLAQPLCLTKVSIHTFISLRNSTVATEAKPVDFGRSPAELTGRSGMNRASLWHLVQARSRVFGFSTPRRPGDWYLGSFKPEPNPSQYRPGASSALALRTRDGGVGPTALAARSLLAL